MIALIAFDGSSFLIGFILGAVAVVVISDLLGGYE